MKLLLDPIRKQTYFETSQISPMRSAFDSPNPRIPPEQTLIPASRTLAMVPSRSSYDRVVITYIAGELCETYSLAVLYLGIELARGVKIVVVGRQTAIEM